MTTTIETIIERLAERELLDIAARFAREHDVTVRELVGPSHQRACAWARQAMWNYLQGLGHWSYSRIGELFGRDHSTIMAGVRQHLRRTGVAA